MGKLSQQFQCRGFSYLLHFSFDVLVSDKAEDTTPRPSWREVFHKSCNASYAKLGSWWEQVLSDNQ